MSVTSPLVVRRNARVVVNVLAGCWPEHPVNPEVKPWFPMGPR